MKLLVQKNCYWPRYCSSQETQRINHIVNSFSGRRQADCSLTVTCGANGSAFSLGKKKKAVCTEAHHTPVPHVLLFVMDFPRSKITLRLSEKSTPLRMKVRNLGDTALHICTLVHVVPTFLPCEDSGGLRPTELWGNTFP